MKGIVITLCCSICSVVAAQNMGVRLSAAIKQLEADAQFKHAILSMYVVDSKTGKVIFDKNAQVGLAPASCQKVVTSVSAFELLGKGYQYKTKVYVKGVVNNNILLGGLFVEGFGDPTLGSWRFESTKNDQFFIKVLNDLKTKNIKRVEDGVAVFRKNFESKNIPKGWIWEDIGNYYGAGAASINWHENQYDIILEAAGEVGKPVKIIKYIPESLYLPLKNDLKTAAKGTGDNAYIYLGLNNERGILSGTIPAGEKNFKISGAIPGPLAFFEQQFNYFLKKNNYVDSLNVLPKSDNGLHTIDSQLLYLPFAEYFSPPLDSINYWFLKKSINLYGEAFVKTIAYGKLKFGSTDSGIAIIKNFWQKKGIEPSALNIIDGSGLSPANRVTTNALVTVMQYAQQQQWFASFYYALPEMNGIKMKDGYINGVRSYTGYIKSKTGNEYTFSFIVNNFDGSPGTVREKMWKVLDMLK
jgi:serine-type D-Ala-D-Ala carboxypeptidase/endopeptidase (penicillin-binding protein 4)